LKKILIAGTSSGVGKTTVSMGNKTVTTNLNKTIQICIEV
jgi:cobyrinic acid a,c-diamide synthase